MFANEECVISARLFWAEIRGGVDGRRLPLRHLGNHT